MKKFELLAASAIVMFASSPAWAQNAPAAPAAQTPDQTADDTESAGNDIIVTATKRETTLLDTPIAVSVTSADTIKDAQIRDLLDLQTVVPSLRVSQLQSSANTNFIIRGFGNGANNAGIEPSVGVFIDGVYRSRSAAQIADLPNLKRVEVLRGPQSTLFGKNASAGIISVVTAEPGFEYKANLEGTYGNYNAFIVKGGVSGPITDTLAWSFDGNFNRRDGYVQDLRLNQDQNNRRRWGIRGQLLFQPSADLKFRLIADYDNINERCCSVVNVINGPTGAIVNALAGGVAIDANRPLSNISYTNFASSNNIENYGFSLQGDYSISNNLSLTSITSYRKVNSLTDQDSDFTGADLIGRNSQDLKIDTFTQELRLSSNFEGPFNFLIGGFYFNEKINQRNSIVFGTQFRPYADQLIRAASGNTNNVALLEGTLGFLEGQPARYVGAFFRTGDGLNETYRLGDESISFFGTADYHITQRLTLTGGINYTKDTKNYQTNVISTDVFSGIDLVQAGIRAGVPAPLATNPAFNPFLGLRPFQFLPPFQNLPNAVEPNRTSDSNVSYTARLAYKATKNISFYVTYATGFKASSINLSRDSRPSVADLATLRAQNLAVVNLTSGSRLAGPESSEVFEGGIKGQFSNLAFNAAIFQQSISGFQSNIFTGTGFVLANAGKQSTFGVEFDSSWTPVKALNLNFALTYLDPVYDSFAQGSALNATNGVSPANLTGLRPAGIPEFSISGGASYTHRVSDDLKLTLRGDYQWESSVPIAEGSTIEREVNSLNMSLTAAIKKNVELSVWGRNITDAQYLTTIFSSVAQSGSLSGYHSQPRTFGATIRAKF
ncbi:MAG: TonB-dependent receptor [Sphingomonas sp.]|nr:TonB-dependent receptor [Sphingomonas sp.]